MNCFIKPLCIFFVALLFANVALAQPKGNIDERFELTSIVFRLTDDVAFVHSNPEKYIADIDNYFIKYKNHELITFIKKTMYSKSILDISLPMYFAADVQITPKGIVWTDEWTTTFELYDTLPDSKIWNKKEMNEYLRLLNKFYKDSKFHQFYLAHESFYETVEIAFSSIVSKIDTTWFFNFFGSPFELDNIWLVPANGNFNFSIYRIDRNGKGHHNCAISTVMEDSSGNPYFPDRTFKTLIHEICHNYNNPICKRHEAEFQSVCDTLYTFVNEILIKEYYGNPRAIMYEGFNILCEFAYYKSHQIFCDSILHEMALSHIYKGFFWFEDMQRYLDVFFQNREQFKTFEHFFPSLKLFLNRTVDLMEHYYCPKYDLIRPRVVATYPGYNGVVDTTLKFIMIQFSKPMQKVDVRSIVDDPEVTPLPYKGGRTYWVNDYLYVVSWSENLKPNTKYGFRVNDFFADAVDYYGSIPYDLIFETK